MANKRHVQTNLMRPSCEDFQLHQGKPPVAAPEGKTPSGRYAVMPQRRVPGDCWIALPRACDRSKLASHEILPFLHRDIDDTSEGTHRAPESAFDQRDVLLLHTMGAVLADEMAKSRPGFTENLYTAGVAVEAMTDPTLARLQLRGHVYPAVRNMDEVRGRLLPQAALIGDYKHTSWLSDSNEGTGLRNFLRIPPLQRGRSPSRQILLRRAG
mmetsp:Transcript_32759/g.76545  ORF Transcript_32759/g.76545 Transcript_32759/m.76545 type:complete len:212 (+) Transcript_32759:465-1100(+)